MTQLAENGVAWHTPDFAIVDERKLRYADVVRLGIGSGNSVAELQLSKPPHAIDSPFHDIGKRSAFAQVWFRVGVFSQARAHVSGSGDEG